MKSRGQPRLLPQPEMISVWFADHREKFRHPVEEYDHWVILGLQKGQFRYSFAKKEKGLCEPGEFLVCPPQVPLHREALGAVGFYFIRFRWESELASDWQGKYSLIDVNRLESTLSHLERLREYPGREESAWGSHLLLDLFQQALFEESRPRNQALKNPDRVMIQVAEKLRQKLEAPFQLEELATKIRLTPSQLSRRFKTAFGSNPATFRTQARMQEARRLLLETSDSLEEIALACGYENAFYFSRVFTAQNGRAPSRFRKNLRV